MRRWWNGWLLKRYRTLRGASRASVARAAGVHHQTVMHWEDGGCSPGVDQLGKVCRELQLGMVEMCALLRMVPPGLTEDVMQDFVAACDKDHQTTASVLADFIKGYVYEYRKGGRCRRAS